jgi:hypothetical protein
MPSRCDHARNHTAAWPHNHTITTPHCGTIPTFFSRTAPAARSPSDLATRSPRDCITPPRRDSVPDRSGHTVGQRHDHVITPRHNRPVSPSLHHTATRSLRDFATGSRGNCITSPCSPRCDLIAALHSGAVTQSQCHAWQDRFISDRCTTSSRNHSAIGWPGERATPSLGHAATPSPRHLITSSRGAARRAAPVGTRSQGHCTFDHPPSGRITESRRGLGA